LGNVFDKKLVQEEISIKTIIKNYKYFSIDGSRIKKFKNKVLGYVTPWNSKGYDNSKTFVNKLDIISPVWLQIERTGRLKYQLKGTHDIDANWMKDVRKKSDKNLEFLPRILFENLKMEDLNAMFTSEEELVALGDYLSKKAVDYNFDGYTFEVLNQLNGHSKPQVNHMIIHIADALHSVKRKLALVISPPVTIDLSNPKEQHVTHGFNKEDFDQLKDTIDYFSLMTYDYTQYIKKVGPNAPLEWVKTNIKYLSDEKKYLKKILLGLNFFGYKYQFDRASNKLLANPEAVLGQQFIQMISDDWKYNYDSKSGEHIFVKENDKTTELVWYPTLHSINQRIELAESLGTGLSIWELGQGLDYFFDLF